VRLVTAAEKASFAAFLDAHPNGAPNHTWQWVQFKIAVATWDFSEYATLVKTRTEVVMPAAPFRYADFRAEPGAVHAFSDKAFYGAPAALAALFEDFVNVALAVYCKKHGAAAEKRVMREYDRDLRRLARPPNTDGGLGCKTPKKDATQPWNNGAVRSGLNAEWAFAYHVVAHKLRCRPFPLPRGHFANDGPGTKALARDRHTGDARCQLDASFAAADFQSALWTPEGRHHSAPPR
jgi:hypothetical protein